MTRTTLSSRRVVSRLAIWMISLGAAVFVLNLTLFLQLFIFTDWMHHHDQLHIGAIIASLLTWFFVLRWQLAARRRQLELLEQLEIIRWMNDRIRNALQSIDLLAFAHSEAAEQVRASVDTISAILSKVQQAADSPYSSHYSADKKPVLAAELREEISHTVSEKSVRS